MSRRMERVNGLLLREISDIITGHINDPRLAALTTVTGVDTSSDLSMARVFVSVLGEQAAKEDTLAALRSASGFVRRSLRERLALRSIPAMDFRIDDSIERGAELIKLIDEVAPDRED